jgi:autotransporter-associated beta strand protein
MLGGDLTFASGSGAIVLSGGTAINLAATSTITVNNAADTISSVLSGAATSLTKIGAGTLTLSNTNTYTGATTVNAGTLKLDFSAAGAPTTNIISSSSALVLGGGTLNLTGKASTTNSQAVNGTTINPGLSAITLTANATANPLSLSLGAITRNVGSVLRITQPAGTLSANNGVLTTSGTGGAILLHNGVAFATIGTTDWAGMDASNTWIAPPIYTTATGTSLSGNATMNLASANTTTLSINTTINSLRIAGSRGGTVNINAGSTLTTGGILMSAAIDSNGTASFINGPGSLRGAEGQDLVVIQNQGVGQYPLTIAAPIVNNVSATRLTYDTTSGAVLTLTGSNTYTGTTRILGGTLSIGIGGTTGSLDPSSQIVNNGSLILNRSDNITFSNSISGSGTLTKSGAGAVLLSGNNTYSGNTTVSAGTLQIGSDTALGSGILVLNGGAIDPTDTSRTITNQVNLAASSSVVGSQDVTFSAATFYQDYPSVAVLTNNLAAGKKLTINGGVPIKRQNNAITAGFSGTGDTVINGIISKGDGGGQLASLSKSGAGTLTLSGASANTYDGLTTVTGGTLALAKVNGVSGVQAIPAGGLTVGGADNTAATVQYAASTTNPDMMGTGVVTLNGRGILDFNGATDTIGNVAIVSTGATGANPTPIINTAGGGNLTIGTLGITPVAGFTSVVNAGTGTITLGGDVTFNAATNGQAQITGTALSLGAANRNFIVGLGTGAGQDLLIDAQITGASRMLTKSGAGRLTLSNANNYSGGTTVSAGSLLLSGAFEMPTTGTLAVSNGGTFSLADGTARATSGATTGVGLTLATGSWLGFDWNGGSLDSFTTLGTATATGTVVININYTSPAGSGGTLITAAGGSTLNAATYLLANNINYTATISSTPTTVSIGAQTPVTALTDAYWLGNQVAGFTSTMTVSTGPTSNWASDASGTPAGGVVPGGSAVNVIFGATGAAQQANVTTGLSDMNLGSITFNDSAAVTIAGAPNTITLNSTSATAASTLGALQTVTAGSAISVTQYSSTTNTISANLALGANQTWNVASGKTLAVSGIVTGTGSLTLADAGTVTLSTNNTYTGTTTISAGTLQLGNGSTAGSLSPSSAIDNNGNLTINRSDSVAQGTIFASTISGSGSLTKSGAGTLTLSGSNTYTGGTSISGGALTISANASLGASGSRNLTFTGSANLNGFNGASLDALTVNGGATATMSINTMTFATTSGSGSITYPGANNANVQLTLGNASAFTGTLRNNIGGLGGVNKIIQFTSLGDGGALQFGGTDDNSAQCVSVRLYGDAGPLTMTTRQVQFDSRAGGYNGFATAYLINDNASAANKWVINSDLLNAAYHSHTLGLWGTNTGDNEFAGVISDSMNVGYVLGLNKGDVGKWILSGNNTYSGVTTISGGILSINSIANVNGGASALGKPSSTANGTLSMNGGTLQYTGSGHTSDRVVNLSGTTAGAVLDASGTGPLVLTSALTATGVGSKTLTLAGTSTATNTLAGAIVDNGGANKTSLIKTNAGTWVLAGSNTYTGTTTLRGGTLTGVTGGSCLGSSLTVTNTPGVTSALGVTVNDNTKQWSCANLAFTTNGLGSQLKFSFAMAPSTSLAPLSVTNSLTFTGAPVVVVNTENVPIGNYPLLVVGGASAPTVVPALELMGSATKGGSLAWGGTGNKTLYLTVSSKATVITFR